MNTPGKSIGYYCKVRSKKATGYSEKVLELIPDDAEAKKYKARPEKTAAGTGRR